MHNSFYGTVVPLVTPFSGGRVDYAALGTIIDRCVRGGADGLLCLGTTAEAPALTESERWRILSFTLAKSRGLPVICGAGSNCTREAVRLAVRAEKEGANGVLSVCPYYNNPPETGIIAHFRAVAEATSLPVILYDVPKRTGVEISANAVNALKSIPNVVAIKAAGGADKLKALCALSDGRFKVLCGNDGLIGEGMRLGCVGAISAAANVMPRSISRAVRLYTTSPSLADAEMDRLKGAIDALYCEVNPIPIKAALAVLGLAKNELRLPMCPLSHKNEHLIKKYVDEFI